MSQIQVVKHNCIIQHVLGDTLYATEDHFVWKSVDNGKTWSELCRLPSPNYSVLGRLKDFFLRSLPVRELRRNVGINNLVVLTSGTVIIQYDKVYRYSGSGRYAQPVFDTHEEGVISPLKNGLCFDKRTGNLYFGEYLVERPASIRIFRGSEDGKCWDVCYKFPSGQIRHVHGIFADPFRERLWICTGDNDRESGLYYTDDDFRSIHLYGGGDQSWRMVSLLITRDYLIWGSDAGQDAPADCKNFIYRLDLRTGKRERLCCIDKPAYYSALFEDGSMCLATTFEPGIKRKVSSTADLWWSRDGLDWKLVHSFPHKFAGRKVGTRYATIFMACNSVLQNDLFCSPVNVDKYDFKILKVELQ